MTGHGTEQRSFCYQPDPGTRKIRSYLEIRRYRYVSEADSESLLNIAMQTFIDSFLSPMPS